MDIQIRYDVNDIKDIIVKEVTREIEVLFINKSTELFRDVKSKINQMVDDLTNILCQDDKGKERAKILKDLSKWTSRRI